MEQAQLRNKEHPQLNRTLAYLAGDLVAATASAIFVTPLVAIIDRAIVEQSSSRKPLLQGLRHHALAVLRHPGRFVFSKPFGIVWTLYAATYAVANTSETVSKHFHSHHTGSIVFGSTFFVNVPLGVWKDVRFAQLFGAGTASGTSLASKTAAAPVPLPKIKVPLSATGTFLFRDAITIAGSFVLAPWLTASVPESLAASPQAQMVLTQLTVPAFTQIGATPLHLLGLDLCSRPYSVAWSDRIARVRHSLFSTTVVRCIRILPAFGFGCLANLELRNLCHEKAGKEDEET